MDCRFAHAANDMRHAPKSSGSVGGVVEHQFIAQDQSTLVHTGEEMADQRMAACLPTNTNKQYSCSSEGDELLECLVQSKLSQRHYTTTNNNEVFLSRCLLRDVFPDGLLYWLQIGCGNIER